MRGNNQLSGALGVTKSAFKKAGVLDTYAGIDSRLHVDPALLRTTRVPELRGALDTFNKYFENVLKLVVRSKPGDALERRAKHMLVFPEIHQAALGFSSHSTKGRGVSPTLGRQLYQTAKEIIEAGIEDPAIFELVLLFEEGFGPDLISDMTICVILDHLSQYNRRICQKLNIPTRTVRIPGHGNAHMAYSKSLDRCFLLVPKSILNDLPEATCQEDVDRVVAYNDSVREEVNRILGENWSNVAKKLNKRELKKLLLKYPDAFKQLIETYKNKRPESYDFENDPLGEILWDDCSEYFTDRHKLKLPQASTREELIGVVEATCLKFKKLVENNGLCNVLYRDDGYHRPEKFAQLLYFGIADCYCDANNLDLSRECNAGRGPVDFKLSSGSERALVEIKLSSNRKGLEGLLLQLPEYAKAESSTFDILLMVVISENRSVVDDVLEAYEDHRKRGAPVPKLIIVEAFEAMWAPSASKLRFN